MNTTAPITVAASAVLSAIRLIRDDARSLAPTAISRFARSRAAWLLQLIEMHRAAGDHALADVLVEERSLWVQVYDPAVVAALLAIIDRSVPHLAEQLDLLEASRADTDPGEFSVAFRAHHLALQLHAPEQYDRWHEVDALTTPAVAAFA